MATRLYFPATEAAPATPAFDGSWLHNSEAVRRKLAETKGSSAITIGSQIGPWTSGGNAIDRQYISTRLNAGISFVSGSTNIALQLMVREYANTDNVNTLWLLAKIVSEDGNTVRATIRSFVAMSAAEFINNVSHRNQGSNAGCTASYTTVLGDRLLIEIGYGDASGNTPEASAKWGENATDLPINNTQTTDGAGWIEFSNTITFAGELNNPTIQLTSTSYAVSGSNLSLLRSLVGPVQAGIYSISGSSVNGAKGFKLSIEAGNYSVSGSSISGLRTYNLQAQAGSYQVTVSNITLAKGYRTSFEAGNYQVIGSNLSLLRSLVGPVQAGDYQITGSNIDLIKIGSYGLNIEAGDYQITGSNLSLLRSLVGPVQAGSYQIIGSNINLVKTQVGAYTLSAQAGNYLISESNINLIRTLILSIQAGNYDISGSHINLLPGKNIIIEQGSFAIVANNVNIIRTYTINLQAGQYSIIGKNISLVKSSAVKQTIEMGVTFSPLEIVIPITFNSSIILPVKLP